MKFCYGIFVARFSPAEFRHQILTPRKPVIFISIPCLIIELAIPRSGRHMLRWLLRVKLRCKLITSLAAELPPISKRSSEWMINQDPEQILANGDAFLHRHVVKINSPWLVTIKITTCLCLFIGGTINVRKPIIVILTKVIWQAYTDYPLKSHPCLRPTKFNCVCDLPLLLFTQLVSFLIFPIYTTQMVIVKKLSIIYNRCL